MQLNYGDACDLLGELVSHLGTTAMKSPFLKRDVLIAHLRIDDRESYVSQGFGKMPIQSWPVFRFFTSYVQGSTTQARSDYEAWYREQFSTYATEPKKLGGMKGGSLYRLVEEYHTNANETFDLESEQYASTLVELAIRERVKQRFTLLESIHSQGFAQDNSRDPIIGTYYRHGIILRGGHHRVAALAALGHQRIPLMYVYPFKWMVQPAKIVRKYLELGRSMPR